MCLSRLWQCQEYGKLLLLENKEDHLRRILLAYFRTLTTKYQTLLDQATKEIQKLSRDKQNLEKEKKKLLATNVEMAKELTRIYLEQKDWRKTEKGMRQANEEFAAEVEKLYAKEESLREENDMLLKTITILGEEKVQQKEDLSEKIESLQNSLKLLEEEKAQQNVVVKKLFSENIKHVAELASRLLIFDFIINLFTLSGYFEEGREKCGGALEWKWAIETRKWFSDDKPEKHIRQVLLENVCLEY